MLHFCLLKLSFSFSLKDESQLKNHQLKKNQSVDTIINRLDQTWIHPESYGIAHRYRKKGIVLCILFN